MQGPLRDGGRLAVPERAVERGQILLPPREVRDVADAVVQHGSRRNEEVIGRGSGFVLFHRIKDIIAQAGGMVAQRQQIPIGQAREQASRRAFLHAEDHETPAAIERIASHGVDPFRRAVGTCEIFGRKQDNDAPGPIQRIIHAVHKILVGKIPVLKDDAIARVFKDFADDCGEASVRARPRDKKMDYVFRC